MSSDSTFGIVLAGGRGVRLGLGYPKALALLAGVPLVDRAVGTLESLCDEIAIVAPSEVASLLAPRACVLDVDGYEGPLAGIVAGLECAPDRESIVLGVDLPFVGAGLLGALRERRRASGARGVLAAPGGVSQPLAACFAPGSAPGLRAALERGVRALREAVQELEPIVLGAAETAALPGGEEAFFNVNSFDDLLRAEQRFAS
jgi:molybdopterin-guanine dinucleotide biosynthesis protein A